MLEHPPLVHDWLSEWTSHSAANIKDDPHYYVTRPEQLLTHCYTPTTSELADSVVASVADEDESFRLGIGCELTSKIFESCKATTQELLIVTCFWASSESQMQVHDLLLYLSQKVLRTQSAKISVRICFSSLSITQKLFHTASHEGRPWPSSEWSRRLGLPPAENLLGLDLQVKSIFIKPFSVMHPKFIVMDRTIAWLPSCNISWERWFEGYISFSGPLVNNLLDFYSHHWGALSPMDSLAEQSEHNADSLSSEAETTRLTPNQTPRRSVPCLFLPSPHHINPKFRPWPCTASAPPPTPLNTFVLHAISNAMTLIVVSTPNLTCSVVSQALLDALARGVNVWILTSSRLMILEQLVTAGSITEYEVYKLSTKYNAIVDKRRQCGGIDEESLTPSMLGSLNVKWFDPATANIPNGPVKSHFKCTIVDEHITILGSGNMDRASWFTSQELGVAFFDKEIAEMVRRGLESSWKCHLS